MPKRLTIMFLMAIYSSLSFGTDLYFEQIATKHEATQLTIVSLYKDVLGQLWMGTDNGLSRYDGNHITDINPDRWSKQNGRSSEKDVFVYQITGDKKGNIYFCANLNLIKYNVKTDTYKLCSKKMVSAIYEYKDSIWAFSDNKLYVWDDAQQKLILRRETNLHDVKYFLIDDLSKIYVACSSGLYRLDKNKTTVLIKDHHFIKLLMTSKGELWAGTYLTGLYRIMPDGKILYYSKEKNEQDGFINNRIRQLVEDQYGNIWFGTFAGLCKYDYERDKFVFYQRDYKEGSLSGSSVDPLFLDDHNVLWIGTYYGGVNYCNISKELFKHYAHNKDRDDCLTFPVVSSMVEDDKGNVWIGTEGGGLNCLNPKTGKIKHFIKKTEPYYLPNTNINSMAFDEKRQKLYIVTSPNGLYSYNVKNKKFVSFPIGKMGHENIYSFIFRVELYNDNLYVSTSSGIYKIDLNDNTVSNFLPNINAGNFIIDSKGYLVLLKNLNTILRVNCNNVKDQQLYKFTSGGDSLQLSNIIEVDSQTYLLNTYKSKELFSLDLKEGKFHPFLKSKKSILSNRCYKLCKTPKGNFIITGDKGIVILNKNGELLKSLLPEIGKSILPIVEDCGIFMTKDSSIYVGGSNGLISFKEDNILFKGASNKLYFSELYSHGKKIRVGDHTGILKNSLSFISELKLKHNQNNFSIAFASSIIDNDFKPYSYEYKLEGFNKEWSTASSALISYTNLEPGAYNLRLRQKINYKYKDKQAIEASLSIIILEPWYNTIWAWICWVIICFVIFYVVVRTIRVRQNLRHSLEMERLEKKHIKDLNESKLRFFTNISHEFRTPLTLIGSQVELLLQNSSLVPSVYNKLLKISRQSFQMNHLVSELLDFRKCEQNHITLNVSLKSLNVLLKEVGSAYQDLALKQNIQFTLELPKEESDVWIDDIQMQKVFYNLLSNAFKFTPEQGNIKLSLQNDADSEFVVVRVKDAGIGIEEKDLSKIFDRFYQTEQSHSEIVGTGIGLALAKDITELHHGKIKVESVEGMGSTFSVYIRKGFEHFKGDNKVVIKEHEEHNSIAIKIDQINTSDVEEMKKKLPDNEGEKYLVLLIEDNEELLLTLVEIFSPLYKVQTAINGREGLEKAKELKPDLIVSDVLMPLMSGTELCLAIKNNIELSHIPIVLLTALNLPEHNIEGLRVGADDYIAKPFNTRLLLARCNNLICSRKLLLQRYAKHVDTKIELLATTPIDKEFLDKVVKIIDEHIRVNDFDVKILIDELGMGRTTFFQKFKALTGMTPYNFIKNHRMKKAAEMLIAQPNLSISEVAFHYNFSTLGYFGRCFKDQFGVSPVQFRSRKKANNIDLNECNH